MRRPVSHPLALQRLADAQHPDGSVDPLAAAIAIATHLHPTLQPKEILDPLDRFADETRSLLDAPNSHPTAAALANALNQVLFEHHGFTGNRVHYDDPLNSYIDEVLQRRTGLPILLSLLYAQIAHRAGGTAHGIGLPSHFIVALDNPPREPLLIDPFNAGIRLSPADCRQIAANVGAPWSDEFLLPVDGRRWTLRILLNLRNTYAHMGDAANTAATLEQMLLLEPALQSQQRELQHLYTHLTQQSARNN